MSSNRMIYLPLGGAGEIGMNAYVYGYGPEDDERLILVDMGVTFPDMDTTPGVDLIMADMTWLIDRRNRLDAIFITHGHEDHIGAVGMLWDRLRAPVYARAFTANLARRKMQEHGAPVEMVKTVSAWPERTTVGPFTVGFAPISHSIPESSALVIDTAAGRYVHSGDFKLDRDPLVGEAFDPDLFQAIAADGVQALICDSTNVFSPHPGRSEATLGQPIAELIASSTGMFVATTFASNVARVRTLAEAGVKAGRSVCLMGRAMRRMIEASVETGVLSDFPKVVSVEDAGQMPRENLMLIVTGSQGERRAASAQLAQGKYHGIELRDGDSFLFSSKTIPGNERGVIRIINQLSERGVDVIDDSSGLYHVSGHANRPDLEAMHDLIRPKMVIPMHGEHRHLRAHVKLAQTRGMAAALAVNGTMLDLTSDRPLVAGYVETGRRYRDGSVEIGALDGIIRDRIRMALNGRVVVSVLFDEEDEPMGEPWVDLHGLSEIGRSNAALADVLEEDLSQFLNRAAENTLSDDTKLEKELTRITRQTAMDEIGKKPEVTVILSRLS